MVDMNYIRDYLSTDSWIGFNGLPTEIKIWRGAMFYPVKKISCPKTELYTYILNFLTKFSHDI